MIVWIKFYKVIESTNYCIVTQSSRVVLGGLQGVQEGIIDIDHRQAQGNFREWRISSLFSFWSWIYRMYPILHFKYVQVDCMQIIIQ